MPQLSPASTALDPAAPRVRRLAWLSAYGALVLLPLAAAALHDPFPAVRSWAVEGSVALGLLAFPLVLAQFALVSRLGAVARPFGLDALVAFHRYMGWTAVAFVVAHPLLLGAAGFSWAAWNPFGGSVVTRSGAIALWTLLLLVGATAWRRRLRLSYEAWRGSHALLAIVAAAAMSVHLFAVNGYSRGVALRIVLVTYLLAFGGTILAYRVVRPWRLRARPWSVVDNRDEGADVRTLRLRPVGHSGFAFAPGQFAWLITGASPYSSQQHPLSIASSAAPGRDGAIEFAIKALGDWSGQVVPALSPGTTVWVDGPFGTLTIDGKAARGFLMFAGGIGIVPMRSMLRTMRDRGDRRHVVLFYAAHDPTRAPFGDDLRALGRGLHLDFVEVFEAPPPNWAGERGRITADVIARHLPPAVRQYHAFVCGPVPMMNAVEAFLVDQGVPPGSIESERFTVV